MTDFDYYCNDFGGVIIDDEEEFCRLGEKARRFIGYISCAEPDYESDDVKSCVCALADVYAENGMFAGIIREKIDGFETEYESGGLSDELMHTAKLYLPTMLLYRGL